MKNRIIKLLPLLLAFVMMFSLALPALADGEDGPPAAESTIETIGATDDTASAADATESTTADESAADTASADATASEQAEDNSAEDTSSSSSGFTHWPRVISLIIIVVLIGVAILLAHTNTKFGQKIAKFFRDYKSEIRKISWYPRKETIKATGIVLVVLIGLALAIGILDFLFTKGIQLLANLF